MITALVIFIAVSLAELAAIIFLVEYIKIQNREIYENNTPVEPVNLRDWDYIKVRDGWNDGEV